MKYVLITGAGNGLGYKTAKYLSSLGYFVYACDINIDTYDNKKVQNVLPIKMDVTDDDSILKAFELVKKTSPKIDAIINYAGVSCIGSLIETKIEKMMNVVDINLFGTIRVNKVFYYLLNEGTGRIINISSENGWQQPAPFNGIYSMSKYALEAYNDSLRRELMFLKIKVIKIQPGSFKSNMHNIVRYQYNEFADKTKLYHKIASKMGRMINKELDEANDVRYLLVAVREALESSKPKLCYRVKNGKKLSAISRLRPSTLDKLFYRSLNGKRK